MDVKEFQKAMEELCALGRSQNRKITGEQLREYFGEAGLKEEQLQKVMQYLRLKGIEAEGTKEPGETAGAGSAQTPEEDFPGTRAELGAGERAYLQKYLDSLETVEEEETEALFAALEEGNPLAQARLVARYLPVAARLAAECNCQEIPLADLIQEANVSLLLALEEEFPGKDERWLEGRIRGGILQAIEQQSKRKFQDDYLVSKVENLESAVRELTEEDEETQYSLGELSVLLDMSTEEIRDILRLTGDD
ncbi:MAG: hypothetical protein LUF78_12040 [Clostridiales bacterium]|nr:hypothetical protein [Clostridiales bacterium]MCD8155389.1 hypothetical protein [Clostridiales bacterium]